MAHEWKTSYCTYDVKTQSQVKATVLNYNVSKTDGEFYAGINGTVDVSEQNRVYTLAALKNVPNHVMTKWVTDALGAEQVQSLEDNIDARIAEQKTPTSGGFVPDDDGAGTLPA